MITRMQLAEDIKREGIERQEAKGASKNDEEKEVDLLDALRINIATMPLSNPFAKQLRDDMTGGAFKFNGGE